MKVPPAVVLRSLLLLQLHKCATRTAREPPHPPSPFKAAFRDLDSTPILDELTLARLQAHPALAPFDIVSFEGTSRVPRGHTDQQHRMQYAYNPAILDEDNVWVKLSPYSLCYPNASNRSASGEVQAATFGGQNLHKRFTVWLQRNRSHAADRSYHVRHVTSHAEDARPFRIDGQVHMLFTRKAWYRRIGLRKRIWLATFEPMYREVQLQYAEASADEANWVPIESRAAGAGAFFVSYALCPHIVLRCEASNGRCVEAHRSGHLDCHDTLLRGGTQLVRVRVGGSYNGGNGAEERDGDLTAGETEWLVAVAHRKQYRPMGTGGRDGMFIAFQYAHALLWFQPSPPFAIVDTTEYFSLPPFFGTMLDGVQFCAGALVDNRQLVLTYGVADCVALRVSIPLDVIASLIQNASWRCTHNCVDLAQTRHLRVGSPSKRLRPDVTAPTGLRSTGQATLGSSLALGNASNAVHTAGRLPELATAGSAASSAALPMTAASDLLVPSSRTEDDSMPDEDSMLRGALAFAPQSPFAASLGGSESPQAILTVGTPTAEARLTYAVVIKGPLQPFTRAALSYYLASPGGVDRTTTAVVFSHNTGSCATNSTTNFLSQLVVEHAGSFGVVLTRPPPHRGVGFRNYQREACYFGALYAVRRWRVEYILMHRADGAFQKVRLALPGLALLLSSLPSPPARLTGGRLGWCPYQTQLTDYYGRYHLDDHCTFGPATAFLRFFSPYNPFYRRSLKVSTRLPKAMLSHLGAPLRRACSVPGPEAENGVLWAMWDAYEHPEDLPLPNSTQALIFERGAIFDPAEYEHVVTRDHALPQGKSLPVNPRAYTFRAPGRLAAARAPYGAFTVCVRRSLTVFNAPSNATLKIYECPASAAEVHNQIGTPSWPCPDSAVHTNC